MIGKLVFLILFSAFDVYHQILRCIRYLALPFKRTYNTNVTRVKLKTIELTSTTDLIPLTKSLKNNSTRYSLFLTLLIIIFGNHAFAKYDKEAYGTYKIGNPYKIGSKMYYPKEYTHLQEEGFVSWYGPGFHNKKTSNGATFNKNSYTAAHKTLPIPSVVEFTNLENGKRIILVVNHRGPFSESQSRILDVSEHIARDMGFLNAGVTKGRIRFLPKETKDLMDGKSVRLGLISAEVPILDEPVKLKYKEETTNSDYKAQIPAGAIQTSFDFGYLKGTYIQIGAFKSRDNAMRVLKSLQAEGIEPAKIRTERTKSGDNIDLVRVGPIEDEELVENILAKIHSIGYKNAKVLMLK